ncbi:hypothetical protein, partial [Streptomyces sp. NPDC087787]|uniref:hypothetical protein n=1 Tax=Streptomyces sp. NPDC087787 TaxID=3365803 RepID=UPI003800080C
MSDARYDNECAPTPLTCTGAEYATYAAPSSEYSIFATPDPESEADTVTVALPTKLPDASFVPDTDADVSGGVLSSGSAATTENSTDFTADAFPALSDARY